MAVNPVQGRPWMSNAAILIAILILIGCPIASAFAWWEIESIVFSGAAFFIAGLILLVLSTYCRYLALRILAITTMAFVLGIFFTIFINRWSPGDAAKPIGTASIVISVVMQWGWFAIRQATLLKTLRQDLDRDGAARQPTVDTSR